MLHDPPKLLNGQRHLRAAFRPVVALEEGPAVVKLPPDDGFRGGETEGGIGRPGELLPMEADVIPEGGVDDPVVQAAVREEDDGDLHYSLATASYGRTTVSAGIIWKWRVFLV